jgi:ligand-binding sensor domain-containing protein
MFRFWTILLIAGLIGLASCEKEDLSTAPPLDSWTTFNDNGLGDAMVYSIIQDKKGTIWAGTNGNGLYKYSDGDWTHLKSSPATFLDDYIFCLKEEPNGTLWIGSYDGISRFDGQNWSHLYTSTPVLSMDYFKADETMYFGLQGTGFIYYLNSKYYPLQFNDTTLNTINSIFSDSKNFLWLGTKNGIVRYYFDKGNSEYSNVLYRKANGLNTNNVNRIYEDSKGRVWIGTWGGTKMQWFENNAFHDAPYMSGMDNNYTLSIGEDMLGNIWFGTISSGAFKYNGSVMEPYSPKDGLCDNTIVSIFRDRDNQLWFGGLEGGITRLNQAIPQK